MPLDSVELEIMSRKLSAITDEMYFSIQRAARSSFVKEAADFATAILDVEGDVYAYPPSASFSFLIDTNFRSTIDAMPGLRPGDVIFTNDPYTSQGLSTHLPDLHVIQPYFDGGRIVSYGWAFVHCSDIGGAIPGSVSPALTSIFEEGFRIPPMLLVRNGELNEGFVALLRVNSRMPDVVLGDVKAMLGALETGNRRLQDLIAKQGVDRLLAAQRELQDDSEAKARAVFRRIPDGVYEFWDLLDDDMQTGIPIRVRLAMRVKDGNVELDITGTDPAVGSAYNVPSMGRRMYWLSFRLTTILTTFDPLMLHNAGMYRPITVVNQPGSVMNAEFPDAVSMRNSVPYRLFDCVTAAVLKADPSLLPAPSGGAMVVVSLAEVLHGTGDRVVEVIEPMRGGMGAFDGRDGFDAHDNSLNNMRNLPTELVESQSSIRIIEYDINTDSGGPGRWRGGVGQTLTVESLCDDGIIIVAGLDRMRFPTFGVAGGRPGAPMRAVLNRGRACERQLGKVHELYVRRGDTVTILMPGGGGFGDPLQRDPLAVLSDVLRGFVTVAAAERDYGVIIKENAVDVAASAAYRAGHSHDVAPSAITFSQERLDWEAIFPDDLLRDLNRHLYALPKSIRQQTRRQLFEIAVPGILAHDRPPLAVLVDDPQVASARLRDALLQFSQKSSVERAA